MLKRFTTISCLLALGACATSEPWLKGEPTVFVTAAVETVVTTDLTVDADDPALWADPRDPSRALLFGTDKTDGLYVHNLDGTVRQFLASGAVNNVDTRNNFVVNGRSYTLVAASNDMHMGINLYLLDPDTLEVRDWGFEPTGEWIPYGFCMGQRGDDYYLVAGSKNGEVRIYTVAPDATGAPDVTHVRTLRVGTQPEGCVVDDAADKIYVGEEDVALWRFDFNPQGSDQARQIAVADGTRFTADIEGVTIMRDRGVSYLIASSQGDYTFPVYRIEGDAYIYLGRFHVQDGPIDAVTETDGVDAFSGPIGQFPEGAIAMHDTADAPTRGQQNFKIVDWRDVKRALGIE